MGLALLLGCVGCAGLPDDTRAHIEELDAQAAELVGRAWQAADGLGQAAVSLAVGETPAARERMRRQVERQQLVLESHEEAIKALRLLQGYHVTMAFVDPPEEVVETLAAAAEEVRSLVEALGTAVTAVEELGPMLGTDSPAVEEAFTRMLDRLAALKAAERAFEIRISIARAN